MITNRSRLILIGILTLLVGLVVLFPARIANQWFVPSQVSMSGIKGSVWRGSAEHADFGGMYVRNLSWKFRPLAIFSGGLGYGIEAEPSPGTITGSVVLGLGGTVSIRDVNGTVPLQSLAQIANTPGLQGRISLQLERVILEDGLPVAADGEVQISNLVAPVIHRGSIGSYKVELFTQNSGVMGSVEDTDAVIDLAGSIQLRADRSYAFLGLVAPTERTPSKLRQQMQFLGTANERGQYELRLEGNL